MQEIESDISKIARKNDINFIIKSFKLLKLESSKYKNGGLRKLLKGRLEFFANSHFIFIKKTMNQKSFWKYQQMAYMVDAHKKFLKNEYTSMIKTLIDENLVKSIFELNFDIVENQLKKDKDRIMEVMNPFIEKIKTKSCTEIHDLRNTMKKGTNYAMKETENLREVKVTVQINKDLKSEIPQDF